MALPLMRQIHYHQVRLAQSRIGLVEAEDVLYDGWTRRRSQGDSFLVHGRSLEGRLLELEGTLTGDIINVDGGRDLDELERASYRRRRFQERPKSTETEASVAKPPRRAEQPLPPRAIHTQVLGLRMDDESMQWLAEAAAREGVSASVLARMWVLEKLGQQPPPV
jgi:hypothetical protein